MTQDAKDRVHQEGAQRITHHPPTREAGGCLCWGCCPAKVSWGASLPAQEGQIGWAAGVTNPGLRGHGKPVAWW
jgi:hypothetical protein